MSEPLELQLPPKPYCEWQEGRIRYRITRDADGGGFSVFRKLPFSKEWQYLPWVPHCLTVAFGALAWGREAEKLAEKVSQLMKIYNDRLGDSDQVLLNDAEWEHKHARAHEAAWRERAAGSEKGAAE